MTREEFNRMRFFAGMNVMYKDEKYGIESVNFTEGLLGLREGLDSEEDDLTWVRCESVELLP